MFNLKNNIVPTPLYNKNCRLGIPAQQKLFAESCNLQNPNGQTLTPTLSQRRGNKCAFTLAEVLITLVIIGVVGALTIPTTITKYQKEMFATRLKQTYSSLLNAKRMAENEYGPAKYWDDFESYGSNLNGASKLFTEKFLLPYLSVQKNCKYDTNAGCEHKVKDMAGNYPNKQYFNDSRYYKFYLNNGVEISIYAYSDVAVHIDVNGKRGPNVWGKDAHRFMYKFGDKESKNFGRLIPNYLGIDRSYTKQELYDTDCNKQNASVHNDACTAVLVLNNWKFPDDYPW